ncbi:MAG TPA: FGGY-family carbohydrate kinase, partial [Spirochaetia bacterium]|nr:FGGY-family carbohydrate kinase [Spirochaetia bacterium]
FGYTDPSGPFSASIPITGILGDQQSALFGQACFEAGMSKNTYGTGCFMLMNTGEKLVHSKHGLLSTVASQIGNAKPQYALEGSVAVAGALVQWFRDNLGLIKASKDIEALAAKVEDSGDVYIVPAFSGLFAPYWRPDARGVIVGLTGYANASHLARAVLEATAFQTKDMFDAMEKDAGLSIPSVRVDGGMVVNELLMQFQADILDRPVLRPKVTETTALGAAYAAGLGCGFFKNQKELAEHWALDKQWNSRMAEAERARRLHYWKKAVERTLSWVEQG